MGFDPVTATMAVAATALKAKSTLDQGRSAANLALAEGQQAQLEGDAAYRAALSEAAQARTVARQTRSVSQQQGETYRRDGARLLSTQRVALANTGFASDDATATVIKRDTLRDLTLNELMIRALGEDEARQQEFQGDVAEYQGKLAKQRGDYGYRQGQIAARDATKASRIMAAGQILEGGASWRNRYGSGSRVTAQPRRLGQGMPTVSDIARASANLVRPG